MQKQKNQHHKKQTSDQTSRNSEQTFLDHLHELRARLFWVVASLFIASTVAYVFRESLVHLVIAPLHGSKLIYLNPGGGFTFIFTICLYFGALTTIPVVMYQLYQFLQPVIGKSSRRFIIGIVSVSISLALLGVGFSYLLVIPGALHFLGEFADNAAVANLTTDSYLNFIVLHLFGIAALFQLPLLLFMSDHIRPFPPGTLLRLQRWVIAGSLIAAALMTPTPDPINLALVALPIIGVYQIGVIVVWVRRRQGQSKESQELTATAPDLLVESIVAAVQATPTISPPLVSISASDVVSKPKYVQLTRPSAVAQSPVWAQVATPQSQRSLDGFSTHMRSAGSSLPVRPRPIIVPARQQQRSQPLRRVSIDGFSIV